MHALEAYMIPGLIGGYQLGRANVSGRRRGRLIGPVDISNGTCSVPYIPIYSQCTPPSLTHFCQTLRWPSILL
jgi:hypothetical protein